MAEKNEVDIHYSNGNDILLLGIGNFLMGDEGVGVHLIHHIDESRIQDKATIVDGGTGGFLLVPYLENHSIAVLVDATMDGKEDGTISLLKPKFSNDFPIALSGHNFGLKDMVEILTMLDKMPEIYLYTISISEIKPMCTELSPKVRAAMHEVSEKVYQLIEKLSAELQLIEKK